MTGHCWHVAPPEDQTPDDDPNVLVRCCWCRASGLIREEAVVEPKRHGLAGVSFWVTVDIGTETGALCPRQEVGLNA